MVVYRSSKPKWKNSLSGAGAKRTGGRWNLRGTPVVYTSETKILSREETFNGPTGRVVPKSYVFMHIEIPDDLKIKIVTLDELKAAGIVMRPEGRTREEAEFGDRLLRALEYPVIAFPTAVDNEGFNYLINPDHPDVSRIKIVHHSPFWDRS